MEGFKKVQIDESGRLDQFVSKKFGISRSQAIKHIRSGCVDVNNVVITKASKKIKAGDSVELKETAIPMHNEKRKTKNPKPIIDTLYDSPSCFVVNKPTDLIVHPASTMDESESTLIDELTKQHGGTPSLVHRLDRGTTGCLLVAKSPEICEKLQEQFKERDVKKQYLAICAGVPKKHEAKIEAEIGRSLINRTKMSLFRTSKSRHSATSYKVISYSDEASLLQCDLHTGRTHQIRVHLSSIGHPILGDQKYSNDVSRKLAKKYSLTSPYLHALSLTFLSPESRGGVQVEAPIPESFKGVADRLGLEIYNS